MESWLKNFLPTYSHTALPETLFKASLSIKRIIKLINLLPIETKQTLL
jgi:hypothetical protein